MEDWITYLALIIAFWGAVLSTYTRFYENRRTVKLEVTEMLHGIEYIENKIHGLEDEFEIRCTNNERRPIQIDAYGINTERAVIYIKPKTKKSTSLSIKLGDGDGFRFTINVKKLLSKIADSDYKNIKYIRGFVSDASNDEYFSKKIKFDAEKLLEYHKMLPKEKS